MMKSLMVFFCLISFCVNAQVIINSSGFVQIDFNSFTGAGFSPSPTAGQLDSDTWSIIGLQDGDLPFGGNQSGNDFAKGLKDPGVGRGGIYSFIIGENDNSLGFQPTESDLTSGSIILKITNNTGGTISKLNLSYDIYCYNDKDKSSYINFSHYRDNVSSMFISIPSLDYTSPESKDDSPVWVKTSKQKLAIPALIFSGSNYYLRWTTDDVGGSGSRDEFALDNITISSGDEALPVELVSFTSSILNKKIHLNWNTATETNNYGFEIQNSLDKTNWSKLGFIEGHGTSAIEQEYSFVDSRNTPSGIQFYRLKQIDTDGTYDFSDIIEVKIELPSIFSLSQNYPNPFNPTTTIKYNLPKSGFVQLKLYDSLGQLVKTLVDKNINAGEHNYILDMRDYSTGVYIYELRVDDFVESKKLSLIK